MFAIIDDETALRCLQQVCDQLGLKYRRTKPGEEGGFFYKDKDGNLRKYTGEDKNDPIVESKDVLLNKVNNQNESEEH